MNKKLKIRVIVGSILLILSISVGIYSYLQLANREQGADIDLFSLVPENSVTILETNNLTELMENIEQVSFAQQYDSLHISDLLDFLKSNIDILKANAAHGLSSQLNQMLISFHNTGNPKDQVLYGKLAAGDKDLVENLIKKNCTDEFSAKTFEYHGEKIHIYPLGKDDFLACFIKPGFYAVSYQKKLIEEVIDAYIHKKSILNDQIFTQFLKDEKSYSSASLYIKARNIPVGKDSQGNLNTFHLARWTAFKINMKGNSLYLNGNCIDTDTCLSFENMLKVQQPIPIYPSKNLPESTSFFYQMAISNFGQTFSLTNYRKNMKILHNGTEVKNDTIIHNFLSDHSGDELRFIIFHDDIRKNTLRKVMSVEMKDPSIAEEKFNTYIQSLNKENRSIFKTSSVNGKSIKIFVMPENSIFAQFSSNPYYISGTYGCFYDGNLLVSPNDSCIYSYIRQIESKKSMENNSLYEKCLSNLSSESNYLSIIDMEDAVLHPDIFGQLIPNFFIRNQDFFKHFILTIQFTCVNGNTYPYLVLMHKNPEDQRKISMPSKVK